MNEYNLMRAALGPEWERLPDSLRAHYQSHDNVDVGELDIEYPAAMQPMLNLLRLVGALLNQRARGMHTTVTKRMRAERQYWQRLVYLPDGKRIQFNSHWEHAGGNRIVEYVNPLLGLCMAVSVRDGKLSYQGQYFVLKLGRLSVRLPEWLLLGHTTILEQALDERRFAMDFRLHHPLFGQIYRYAGVFTTEAGAAVNRDD